MNRSRNNWSLRLLVILLLAVVGTANAQSTKDGLRIPTANLPCSPEECDWWTSLREAGEKVFKSKGSPKQVERYSTLFQEGVTKGYQLPLDNSKVVILHKAIPHYSELGRQRQISGVVKVRAMLLANGTVGPVTVVEGLGFGLDENAVDAVRQTVFLPMIKERKFVQYPIIMVMSYSVR